MQLKKPAPPSGAPEWIVTYGDMMSLLLCFFILLAAMANYDTPPKEMHEALQSIRDALSASGQVGSELDPSPDLRSLLLRLQTVHMPDRPRKLGQSAVAGVAGEYYKVQRTREGIEVRVGGPLAFERFSARLEPETDLVLRTIATELRGHLNRIEIRGHTTVEPLPRDVAHPTHLDLSFARARSVYDRLIELGLSPRALRLVAAGANEPVLGRAYSEERLAVNRRVEIHVMQSSVLDYEGAPRELGDPPQTSAMPPGAPVSG